MDRFFVLVARHALLLHSLQDPVRESRVIPALNERILQHNAQLTAFIAKLSEEKRQLRHTLVKLEEETWKFRQREHNQIKVVLYHRSVTQQNRGARCGIVPVTLLRNGGSSR